MTTLLHLVRQFLALLRAVLADGWKALALLGRLLAAWLERLRRHRGMTEHERNRDPSPCTPIQRPEFHRPDPLIYAQFYLMGLGFAITWDNPDITVERPGPGPFDPNAPPNPAATVPSSALAPNTEYDIVVRIWNGSPDAPVVGLPVHFGYLSFGMGVTSTPIGSTTTNLGVKGSATCPAYARMRWRTPATAGHYCLQVLLTWFDDLNPFNNYGQENTQVGVAASPATFTFRLGNVHPERQTFRFEADAFAPAPPQSCARVDRRAEQAARRDWAREQRQPVTAGRPETFPPPAVPPALTRAAHPVPEGWRITFSPATPTLVPGAEVDIRVDVEPPATFHGRTPINVHGFSERGLTGGVTLMVERA